MTVVPKLQKLKDILQNIKLPTAIAFFCISLNCTGSLLFYDASYRILYLDMLGTMISSIILGPAWGVMVGILTNILSSFFLDPSFRCFAVVNVVGALYWGYWAHGGAFTLPQSPVAPSIYRVTWKWIVLNGVLVGGIFAGVVTSVPASVLQRWLFNYDTGSSSSYLTKYAKEHFSFFINLKDKIGDYACDFIIDWGLSVPDKLLTSLLAIIFCITILRYYAGRMTGRDFSSNWSKNRVKFFFNQDPLPCIISGLAYVWSLFSLSADIQKTIVSNVQLSITMSIPLIYCTLITLYALHGRNFRNKNSIIPVKLDEMLKLPQKKDLGAILVFGAIFTLICVVYFYLVKVVFDSDVKHIYFNEIAKFKTVEDIIKINNIWKTAVPPILLLCSLIWLEYCNSKVLEELKEQAQARIVRWFSHNISPKANNVQSFFTGLTVFLQRNQLTTAPFQEIYFEGMKVETISDVAKGSSVNAARIERGIKILKHMLIGSGDWPTASDVQRIIIEAAEPFRRKFSIQITGNVSADVMVYSEYLAQVIDNLLMNAENHAFRPVTPDSKVIFHLSDDVESISITYRNNGRPLPSGFTKEKFMDFQKKLSDSSNEGLGGAFIGYVIEGVHKGRFEIIEDSNYSVNFKITIPKGIIYGV